MKDKHLQQSKSLTGLIFKISVLCCLISAKLNAQCVGTNNFPTGTLSISPYVQTIISTNTNAGDYSIDNFGTAGEYVVNASFATFLTVTDNSNNPIASGYNPLNVTIPTSGNYRIHVYNTNACGLGGGSRIVAVSPRNRAFFFDGVDDYMNLGTGITSSLSGSTKLTVEAWVKPGTMTNLGCIVGNYNTTNNSNLQFLLRRSGNSYYEFWVGNGTTWNQVTSSATPTTNIWQHVAATWDGSVSKIYINGVLSGTVATTISSLGNAANNTVWIGANNINENFNGSVDEVRIWSRTLCQAEIQNYMGGSIPTTGTGLMANYHFDQGVPAGVNTTVTTLTDNSGNNYNGTVTNAALNGSTSNWVASTAFYDGTAAPAFVSPIVSVTGPTSVCSGNSVTLTASGNVSTYNWVSGPATASISVTPTVTSTYSVTGTNSGGCLSNVATYTVTYNATPTITVNSGSVCPGNSFTIIPSGALTYTIQGGSSIVTPSASTNYTVIGTSSNGCVSASSATSNVTLGTCAIAEALNTDGSNDYVSIPQSLSSDFTIEYWMKTTQTGLTGPQWYFGNGLVDAEVGGVVNDFGTALVGSQVGFGIGNPDVTIFSTSNVNTGNWTHVAATWKQSIGEMKLYINGVLENTGTSGTALRTAPPDIKIGVLGTLLRYLNVNIDELRLWNVVRTQCEINTYKNCEIPSTATGLIANYHFNQGYSSNPNYNVTTLSDISGNSNNGTLYNFALNGSTSNWIAPGGVITGSTTPLPPPVVGSNVTNSAICLGNSTTLSGTGASTYTWSGGVSDAVAFSPTATASYTVTGTASTGCTNTAVNSVTVNPIPTVSVNSGTICSGNSFTIVPSGAATYSIQGGNTVVTPTANVTYSVAGTSSAGCISAPVTSSVTVNTTPVISVNSGAICSGNSFTIVPSGASTYSIQGGNAVVNPTANATYSVAGSSTAGCVSAPATSSVTVNPNPAVTAVTSATNFICVGQTATLTAAGASTFTWNTTATTTIIAVSPTITTSYTVTGTDGNGCTNSAVVSQSVSACTSINSVNGSNDLFKVFPNPSNGIFNIEVDSSTEIELFDAQGKTVLKTKVEAGTFNLNINEKASGLYIMKATSNGQTNTIRLIKE